MRSRKLLPLRKEGELILATSEGCGKEERARIGYRGQMSGPWGLYSKPKIQGLHKYPDKSIQKPSHIGVINQFP